MGAGRVVKRYFRLRKRGKKEEASQLWSKSKKKIIKKLSARTQGKPFLSYPASLLSRVFESRTSKEELNHTLAAFGYEQNNKKAVRKIKRDIYYSQFEYRMMAEEYCRYHFENLSSCGRRKYVAVWEQIDRYNRLSDKEEKKIIRDKYRAYDYLKPYYKRDAVLVKDDADLDSMTGFCSRHKEFFVKPLRNCGGHGVEFCEIGQDENISDLIRRLTSNGPVVIEQRIIQGEEMAQYFPKSINTVRIVTANINGTVEIVQSSVRIGMGDSIVDNGCLSASVDLDMGIITSPGRAAHSAGLYIKHPDTGALILGGKIPKIPELKALVNELAHQFKRQRIIGWDLAYSIEGWVVVEANTQPSIQILAGNGVGMRDVFERITKR